MSSINTLILSAGKFNPKNISERMVSEVGLLPIHGKMSIAWVIDSVLKNGADDIKIVLSQSNRRLQRFLDNNYPSIKQFYNYEDGSLISSLYLLLNACDDNKPLQIILGDTFINEEFPTEADVFLSSDKIKSSKQWCLVSKDENGILKDIFNKQRDISLEGKEALVGYYKFSDTKLLKNIILDKIKNNNVVFDFIDILESYNKIKPILIKKTDHWYDFGHISGAVEARKDLFNAREFNQLKVDSVRGTITKKSNKRQKLLDEAYWMKNLPSELLALVPRVFDIRENENDVEVEMELYGYSNLAEIFVYGSNNLEDWFNIVSSLFEAHKLFEKYKVEADKDVLTEIYQVKTEQRLKDLKKSNLEKYTVSNEILINGKTYKNLNLLTEKVNELIASLLDYNEQTVVHGDYCFSNILFDPMHYIFKFIDPRGRFNKQTIYGDPRYDIAKLRHSVVGLYDFIIAGLYKLNVKSETEFEFSIAGPEFGNKLAEYFDQLVLQNGFDLKQIKFIEALLFLTMIPLHSDDEKRQTAFYLIAIQKLNEVLYAE